MSTTAPQFENHLHAREARWFAVYARYKREKQVARRLQEKGIECYLPLQRLTRHYTRKVKHVELPLISGYLFTRITKREYVPVLETQDVVNFVRFSRNLISIPEQEIDIIRRVVGENVEIEVEPSSFRPGDAVEIIGGQLTGMKGILLERRSDKNFVIELESLGYSLLMQVDPALLRRIRPGATPPPGKGGQGMFERY
ncbi:MAG: UpxY family transcription antiterminator [Phaeodactylibacter sp.]|nr:UpxY family transcription antiterminator [Phaeodactylibacter sp.]